MFNHSQIVVGLEIGTAKACVIVAELMGDTELNVLGHGTAPTAGGVRKGEIINADLVEDAVRSALAKAERDSDIEIGSVYLGVTGSHIRGLNSRGMHPISSVDREIDEEDIRQVVKAAQPQLPPEQDVLHTLRQYFRVDGQDDVKNPVGRMASRIELDVHVVCGQRTRFQNPIRLVKGLGIEVADVAFNGRVMALPLLTPQIGEQGALVIDLGAGTTEYAVYLDGSLSHSGIYTIGGDHVTNDLAVGLKLTQSRAERLKLNHGRAVSGSLQANSTVNFSSDVGLDNKQVSVRHLYQIMNARLIELFELIRSDLERNELIRRINGGILLCGGGARMPQIDVLAREVFGLDVLTNTETDALVSQSFAVQPEFVTAMGLVRYGARKIKTQNSSKPGLFGWLVGN
jgi:cell division protein FtsA